MPVCGLALQQRFRAVVLHTQCRSSLTSLNMQGNSLFGTLPLEWGSARSFPKLAKLHLSLNNNLTGTAWLGRVVKIASKWRCISCWQPSLTVPGTPQLPGVLNVAMYRHPSRDLGG